MSVYRRLIAPFAGLAAITAAGTAGYVLVEGMSWADALYMTVITISTVGYGEVRPLSGGGRLFTLILIAGGVGLAFYLLGRRPRYCWRDASVISSRGTLCRRTSIS